MHELVNSFLLFLTEIITVRSIDECKLIARAPSQMQGQIRLDEECYSILLLASTYSSNGGCKPWGRLKML